MLRHACCVTIIIHRCLGLACQGAGRRESAEEYFRLSLELDPLMWVNVQSLCELGANLDVEKHFEEAFFSEKGAATAAASVATAAVAASGKGGNSRPQPGWAGLGGLGQGRRPPPWAPYMASGRGRVGGQYPPGGQRGDNNGEIWVNPVCVIGYHT